MAYDKLIGRHRTMRLLQNREQARREIGGKGVVHPFVAAPSHRHDYHPDESSGPACNNMTIIFRHEKKLEIRSRNKRLIQLESVKFFVVKN